VGDGLVRVSGLRRDGVPGSRHPVQVPHAGAGPQGRHRPRQGRPLEHRVLQLQDEQHPGDHAGLLPPRRGRQGDVRSGQEQRRQAGDRLVRRAPERLRRRQRRARPPKKQGLPERGLRQGVRAGSGPAAAELLGNTLLDRPGEIRVLRQLLQRCQFGSPCEEKRLFFPREEKFLFFPSDQTDSAAAGSAIYVIALVRESGMR